MSEPERRGKTSGKLSASRIRRDAFLNLFAVGWTSIMSAITMIAARSFLVPHFFGVYYLAATISGYFAMLNTAFGTLVDVQIPLSLGRGEEERARRLTTEVYGALSLALLAEAALLFLIAWLVVDSLMEIIVFALVAVMLPFSGIAILDRLLLKSYRRFRRIAIASVVYGAAYPVLVLGFALILGSTGFVVGVAIAAVVQYVSFRLITKREIGIGQTFRLSFTYLKWPVFRFGVIVAMYRFTLFAMETIDRLLVGRILGLKSLGVYSLAVSLAAIVGMVPQTVSGGVLPSYLEIRAGRTQHDVRTTTLRLHAAMVWGTAALSLVMLIAVELVVPPVFTSYAGAVYPTQILLLAEVLVQARSSPAAFVLGARSQRPLLLSSIAGLAVAAGLGIILVRQWALTGAAVATLLGFAASFAWLVRTFDKSTAKALVSHAAGATITVALALLILQNRGLFAATVYALGAGGLSLAMFAKASAGDLLRGWRVSLRTASKH